MQVAWSESLQKGFVIAFTSTWVRISQLGSGGKCVYVGRFSNPQIADGEVLSSGTDSWQIYHIFWYPTTREEKRRKEMLRID